jgi:hypothetical protein
VRDESKEQRPCLAGSSSTRTIGNERNGPHHHIQKKDPNLESFGETWSNKPCRKTVQYWTQLGIASAPSISECGEASARVVSKPCRTSLSEQNHQGFNETDPHPENHFSTPFILLPITSRAVFSGTRRFSSPRSACGWRIVISPAAGHVTLLHSVLGLARIELVVADSKGIGAE